MQIATLLGLFHILGERSEHKKIATLLRKKSPRDSLMGRGYLNCRASRMQTKVYFQFAEAQPTIECNSMKERRVGAVASLPLERGRALGWGRGLSL